MLLDKINALVAPHCGTDGWIQEHPLQRNGVRYVPTPANTKKRTFGATDLLRKVNCCGAPPQANAAGNGAGAGDDSGADDGGEDDGEADGLDVDDVAAETEGLTLDELPTGVLTQEEVDLLVKLYRQQMEAGGPGRLAKRRCNWHDLCYQFNLAVKKNRVKDPSSADRLKLKTPALLKQAQERIAEQAHSRQLLEKSGLLEKYIRVRAWLKDSAQFDFAVPDLRLPGPALGPAAAAPAAATATAAPKLSYHAPLFQLDFAVNKDTSLQVLKRRQKVLCEFRHCLVCESPCQKKTNSGWEIVGDKHTAVPSSGGGWERYPSCADQTLTAGEVKKQVNARARKVYKMKIKVDKLIQKKNNQETK